MKRIVLAFYLAIVVAALCVPRFRLQGNLSSEAGDSTEPPPLVTTTALADSIPSHILDSIGLADVTGIRLTYPTRPAVNYFVYRCNKHTLKLALSRIPFPISRGMADVTYRLMGFEQLAEIEKQLPSSEPENAPGFWSCNEEDYEAIECLKPPYRHIILMSRKSDEVLHRVERLG